MVERVLHLEIIIRAQGARAIDDQRLEQRRAGSVVVIDGQELLHLRQHSRHDRCGHARALLVAVVWPDGVVQILQHLEVIPHVVREGDRHHEIVEHGVRGSGVADRVIERAGRERGRGGGRQNQGVGGDGGGREHVNICADEQAGKGIGRRSIGHRLDGHAQGVGREVERIKVRDVESRRHGIVAVADHADGIGLHIKIPAPGRDEHGAGRDHVRLEAPERTFQTDADVATRRVAGDLIARIGDAQPRTVRLAGGDHGVRVRLAAHHLIGDEARQINRPHRDDVLGRGGRDDAAGHAV